MTPTLTSWSAGGSAPPGSAAARGAALLAAGATAGAAGALQAARSHAASGSRRAGSDARIVGILRRAIEHRALAIWQWGPSAGVGRAIDVGRSRGVLAYSGGMRAAWRGRRRRRG